MNGRHTHSKKKKKTRDQQQQQLEKEMMYEIIVMTLSRNGILLTIFYLLYIIGIQFKRLDRHETVFRFFRSVSRPHNVCCKYKRTSDPCLCKARVCLSVNVRRHTEP